MKYQVFYIPPFLNLPNLKTYNLIRLIKEPQYNSWLLLLRKPSQRHQVLLMAQGECLCSRSLPSKPGSVLCFLLSSTKIFTALVYWLCYRYILAFSLCNAKDVDSKNTTRAASLELPGNIKRSGELNDCLMCITRFRPVPPI